MKGERRNRLVWLVVVGVAAVSLLVLGAYLNTVWGGIDAAALGSILTGTATLLVAGLTYFVYQTNQRVLALEKPNLIVTDSSVQHQGGGAFEIRLRLTNIGNSATAISDYELEFPAGVLEDHIRSQPFSLIDEPPGGGPMCEPRILPAQDSLWVSLTPILAREDVPGEWWVEVLAPVERGTPASKRFEISTGGNFEIRSDGKLWVFGPIEGLLSAEE